MVVSAVYGTPEVAIPKWVRTDPTDVCMRVDQMRDKMEGKRVFMMLYVGNFDVEMIACRSMKDIAFYANYYNAFTSDAKPDDRKILFGNVYKAEVLPYKLSDIELEKEAFFIYDDHIFNRAVSMKYLTHKIECVIKEKESDISKFVVILGRQSNEGVRDKLNKAIERYKDRSLWREDKWALTDVNIP